MLEWTAWRAGQGPPLLPSACALARTRVRLTTHPPAFPPATPSPPRSFVQQAETTAQTFRDLNGELEAAFGPGGGGKLVTPDEMRQALGAADGAALAAALRQAPPGSGPWCVCRLALWQPY